MIVIKFGGSSIDSADAFKTVAEIITAKREKNPIVVLSASGKTTDRLLESIACSTNGTPELGKQLLREIRQHHQSIAQELLSENQWKQQFELTAQKYFDELMELLTGASLLHDMSPRAIDRVLSHGEKYSTLLMSCYLNSLGVPSNLMDSRFFIKTDDEHTQARPLFAQSNKLIEETFLTDRIDHAIPIVQGFIGSTLSNDVSTLGRGGSDYTASIIGAALQVEDIEIWSDVDGILTADPTIVLEAQIVHQMTFREAAELAYFGAKVLHPDTILPAIENGIPIHIYNTKNPQSRGSLIQENLTETEHHPAVKSIAYKENISVLNIHSTRMFQAHDFLRKVFEVLDRHQMVADLVSTSEVSVSIAFHKSINYKPALEDLQKFSIASVENSKAIVCLVGEQMQNYQGLPAKIFHSLEGIHINMISQGASEVNLSFVISESDIPHVVKNLHSTFFEK